MSSLARWTYTQTLTIWSSTLDKYGAPTYGTPYTITGSWIEGGDLTADADGNEFVPQSRFYFEMDRGSTSPRFPVRGDYIAVGDLTATASPITAKAEKIRKITGYDMDMFGADELPDWILFT